MFFSGFHWVYILRKFLSSFVQGRKLGGYRRPRESPPTGPLRNNFTFLFVHFSVCILWSPLEGHTELGPCRGFGGREVDTQKLDGREISLTPCPLEKGNHMYLWLKKPREINGTKENTLPALGLHLFLSHTEKLGRSPGGRWDGERGSSGDWLGLQRTSKKLPCWKRRPWGQGHSPLGRERNVSPGGHLRISPGSRVYLPGHLSKQLHLSEPQPVHLCSGGVKCSWSLRLMGEWM